MTLGDGEERERKKEITSVLFTEMYLQSFKWPSISLKAHEDGHQSSHQRHAACIEDSRTIGANTTVLSTGRSKYVPGNGGSLSRKSSA